LNKSCRSNAHAFDGGRKQLPPIRLPDFSETKSSHEALKIIDNCYKNAEGDSINRFIHEWLEKDPANSKNYGRLNRDKLLHELSPYAMERRNIQEYHARTKFELPIFYVLRKSTLQSVLSEGYFSFEKFLCKTAFFSTGLSSFRSSFVSNGRDLAGWSIVYPHFEQIESNIEKLFIFLKKYGRKQPSFAALVTYVALNNIHPFINGNGRLSRIIFNWIINSCYPNAFYLPIYEISALSEAGLIIRLRQAELHNNWDPLIKFFSDAVSSLSEMKSDTDYLGQVLSK
jgi:hypothetical protein